MGIEGFRAVIAAGATAALCCLVCALWAALSNKSKSKSNFSSNSSSGSSSSSKSGKKEEKFVNGGEGMAIGSGGGGGGEKKAEAGAGSSMMEQLVPEITTHALSYLDCISLCRLSMTNSAMRRAANDDAAWKSLYHKDFTLEQDSITPSNGWKAYYAVTKAVVNLNAEFYNIIRQRDLPAMSQFWLNADYVKCIHASGELFTGYNAVMDSWALAFNWDQGGGQGIAFQIRDVSARVLSELAWVNMKAYVDVDSGPFHVTNVYEFLNERWYMVHHHCSVMLPDGDPGPHNLFG